MCEFQSQQETQIKNNKNLFVRLCWIYEDMRKGYYRKLIYKKILITRPQFI